MDAVTISSLIKQMSNGLKSSKITIKTYKKKKNNQSAGTVKKKHKTRIKQNKHQNKLTEFDSCTERHRWAGQEPHNEKPYPGNEIKELN